ncbi:MAG TPA: DUF4097 family beta strand repeat-containing protein [Opitutaceae bacterium]|nr:DUF4097 family beta strand repeat-containing protein [Opitutaceae bacterium]
MNPSHRCLLVAALLVSPALFGAPRIERLVEKTFAAPAPGTLRAETSGGEIRVTSSPDRTVKITARQRIRASSEAEADEALKRLELVMEQQGADVVLRAKYPQKPFGFGWGSWPPVNVDFIVAVPADFAADLRTSGGPITVADLGGELHARTSGGGIKLGRIGGKVDARTSGGSITLDGAGGPVELETSGGNITVGRVAGRATLGTSGGGIRIESVDGALRANSSGGSIRAAIRGPLKDECVLSTSGGSVKVNVDRTAALRLDASTSGGGVDAEGLTLTLEKGSSGRSRLAGNVNGGGPLLKLRSSGGGITVAAQ